MMTRWTGSGRSSSRLGTATIAAALLLLLLAALAVAACGGGSVGTTATTPTSIGGGGGAQVVMKNFAFDPATVTIKAGESVTWTNQDSAPHTVIADKGEFSSSQLASGKTFSFKFDKAGTYAYKCSIHPAMTGTVVVQ